MKTNEDLKYWVGFSLISGMGTVRFGRLREAVEGPDGALYVIASNRDGRGEPSPADDRILRVVIR